MGTIVIESCNCTWLFDADRMRFRRILKGVDVGRHPATTEWRPYFRLDVSERSEGFIVVLNADGTRLLRSWRHTPDCRQCRGRDDAALGSGGVGIHRKPA